jgi:hypothetical protein
VFAGSAAASAGAAALVVTPPSHAAPARRLAILGVLVEGASMQMMLRRLGDLGEPYKSGRAGTYAKLAKALSVAGAGTVAAGGRRRGGAALGGALVLAGGIFERWNVFKAGFQSAADPKYTVGPQRERIETRNRGNRG